MGWLVADHLVRIGMSMLVGLWVVRYLGPAPFGLLNYASSIVTLVAPVTTLGFEAVLRREFIRHPDRVPTIAGTAFRLRVAGSIVAFAVVGVIAAVSAAAPVERHLLVILGFGLLQPGAMLSQFWLQSQLLAKRSVVWGWVSLVIGAVARLVAINAAAPVEAFAGVIVLEKALNAGLVYWRARRIGFAFGGFDWSLGRALLKECWPLAVSSAAISIYMRIDVLMLRWMVGEAAVGTYAAATKLSELWYFLPTAAVVSVQPALVKAHAEDRVKYRKYLQWYYDASALAAYALAVPMAVFSPWIVELAYGPQFAATSPVLSAHAFAMLFVFLGVARSQSLVNEGYTKFSLVCTTLGAVTNVLLNLLWIPQWQALGAALATLVSYGISAWVTSFLVAEVRPDGWAQTRALLAPLTAWRYLWNK